jgi:hypothetical protein
MALNDRALLQPLSRWRFVLLDQRQKFFRHNSDAPFAVGVNAVLLRGYRQACR